MTKKDLKAAIDEGFEINKEIKKFIEKYELL